MVGGALRSRNKNFHSKLCLEVNYFEGNSTMPISFNNCDVARGIVVMKQTSFPSGTWQGFERALSKLLHRG